MPRACAILLLASSFAGCALAHERDGVHPTPFPDAAPVLDAAAVPDAAVLPDAAVSGLCTDFWVSLPSCPASTESALGGTCSVEGATCGVACCEPGPAIACVGGRWAAAVHESCGIDCAPSTPCGSGLCGPGRVCVISDGERAGALTAQCVVPPAPYVTCDDVPPGALSGDPRSCIECTCATTPTGPVVDLTCACCDHS